MKINGWILLTLLICTPLGAREVVILHTNDLHSRFAGNGPDALYTEKVGDGDPVVGHYGRLMSLLRIKEKEYASRAAIVKIDAGDFFAGTLFHTLAPHHDVNSFPEMEYFDLMNFHATTLGNHEFDPNVAGMKVMLEKVEKLGLKTPMVVSHLSEEARKVLRPWLDNGALREDLIFDVSSPDGKIKVGLIGGLGPDALFVSQATRGELSFVGFDGERQQPDWQPLIDLFQKKIEELREKGCELVILTFHGGEPEDVKLAGELDGVDVIVAGHTHKLYEKPKVVNHTIVVQAGSFARFLGGLHLKEERGKWVIHEDNPVYWKVDDSVPSDPALEKKMAAWIGEIDRIMAWSGFKYSERLASSSQTLRRVRKPMTPLGRKLTTHLLKEVNETVLPKDEPADFYFTSQALIRNDLEAPRKDTPIQFSDAFKFFAIGFLTPEKVGSELVSFYLKSEDLDYMIEFLETYSLIKPKFSPAFSETMSYDVRSWGIPFLNRVKSLKVHGKSEKDFPEFFHIVTNTYVASFFPKVKRMTHGLISFDIYDREGKLAPPKVLEGAIEFQLLARSLKKRGWQD